MRLVVVDKPRTVFENLAINDACLHAVLDGHYEQIVRVYRFARPGVILSNYQDVWDIREEARDTLDITRRPTGGSAVLVDEHTIGYSVFIKTGSKTDITTVYRRFTECPVAALKSCGLADITLGAWYIKLDGSVVAGHAQQNRGFATEFQGIIRMTPWDMAALSRIMRLRTLAEHGGTNYLIVDDHVYDLKGQPVQVPLGQLRRVRDEYAELAAAPSLVERGIAHDDLMERLAIALSESVARHVLPTAILQQAAEHEPRYRDASWVFKQDGDITRCLGHCFVDLVEREPTTSAKPL